MAGVDHDQIRILRYEVYELLVKEDFMWQQRLHVDWLKSRDLNTSYFHSRATQQNRRNFISKLVLDSSVEEEHKIGEALVDYFKNIFNFATPLDFNQVLQGIEPKVTPQMNLVLTRDFTALEIEKALH